MQIHFPSHIKWKREIGKDILDGFSKSLRRKLSSLLASGEIHKIKNVCEPLSEDFLSWFVPKYAEIISGKSNAHVHDIRARTLGRTKNNFPYYGLGLYESGQPVGGMIFSLRKDRVSVAFRVFDAKWNNVHTDTTPAAYGEYLLFKQTQEFSKTFLVHGKDRNPFGLNASIGVAIFKLSVGCYPASTTPQSEIRALDSDMLNTDCLILLQPKTGSTITNAILYVTAKNREKYMQATRYPSLLDVETRLVSP